MAIVENFYEINAKKVGALPRKTKHWDEMITCQEGRLPRKELDHIIFSF